MSANKKEPELLFHNKTSEQINPNMKKQPVEPEEAVYDMENVEQGIAGQPSSHTTCNSKSATQTVQGTLSIASPPINQSTTDTSLELLDDSEQLPMKLRTLGVKPVEAPSISSLSNSKSMIRH